MSESVRHLSLDLDTPASIHIVGIGGAGMRSIANVLADICLLYTSPSPRDLSTSRMPSSA